MPTRSSGQDLTWFFDQVHRSSNVFDYAVDVFAVHRDDRGFGEARAFEPAAHGGHSARRSSPAGWAKAVFPVDVRGRFRERRGAALEVGRRRRGGRPSRSTSRSAPSARRWTPNACCCSTSTGPTTPPRSTPPDRAAARKWSLAWLIWLQDHLLTYGFFICMSSRTSRRRSGEGIRRVNGAPVLLAGAVPGDAARSRLPLSLALRGMLEAHFGRSLVGGRRRGRHRTTSGGRNSSAQATGLGTTFLPSIIGFGARARQPQCVSR